MKQNKNNDWDTKTLIIESAYRGTLPDEEVDEMCRQTEEALRKADNQIIHLRMQDKLLPPTAEVTQ